MKISVNIGISVLISVFCACANIGMDEEYTVCVDSIKLRLLDTGVHTKGGREPDSSEIYDVNVFIFDSTGNIIYRYYAEGSGLVPLEKLPVLPDIRYSIGVIANWGNEYIVGERDSKESFVCSTDDSEGVSGTYDIMTGIVDNVVFPLSQKVLDVGMKRLFSKIRVKCNFDEVDSGVEIKVLKVSINNVPESVMMFEDNVADKVVEGAVLEGDALDGIESDGVEFSLFENLQGVVDGASTNKEKGELLGEEKRVLCSYIELECSYISRTRRGEVKYRFYLGTDHSNCNVYRNSAQTITVKFKETASCDENSVSVDNSDLWNRPNKIVIYPSKATFTANEQSSILCSYEMIPGNVYDDRVVWATSNPAVATVSQDGLLVTQGSGTCTITAASVDKPGVIGELKVKVYNYSGTN